MSGRIPGWSKVHAQLDAAIEALGDVVVSGPALLELAKIRLQLEDVQAMLEAMDANYRSARHPLQRDA